MRTSFKRKTYTVLCLLLSLALLAGCSSGDGGKGTPTASPTMPSTVPDPTAAALTAAPEKNGMTDLIGEVLERCHPGTAGSSLTRAYLAATMVDWSCENGTDAALAGAMAWDGPMQDDFGDSLSDKLEAVYASALSIAQGGEAILEDCGYDGTWNHTEQDVRDAFTAVFTGLGLPMPADLTERGPGAPYTVRVEREAETFTTEDGAVTLLNYDCDIPTVTGNDAINAVLAEDHRLFRGEEEDPEPMEGVMAGIDGFLAAAKEDMKNRSEYGWDGEFLPYLLSRSVDVRRGDERILSIIYDDTTFAGGVHGYTRRWSRTFDVQTGQQLELKDLAEDEYAFLADLNDLLLATANSAEYGVYQYWDDYTDILPTLLRDGNWYLSHDGLVVLANPYELDSYAAGRIEFVIPYSSLRWDLKAEYLPSDAQGGTLLGEIPDERPKSIYFLDDGTGNAGAPVVFTASGELRDFAIHRVSYMDYNNTFLTDALVWYAPKLSDGESVTLLTWIPDAAPNLCVSFTGEKEESYLISQSGRDGSLVLMPMSDFAPLPQEISGRLPFAWDIDGDGERETIDLVQTGGSDRWQLTVDGKGVASDLYAMDVETPKLWLTDLDYDGKAELFFTGDMGSDDYVTCGWRCDTMEPISFAGDTRRGASGEAVPVLDGELIFSIGYYPIVRGWLYQMGTYPVFRSYYYQDGILAPVNGDHWHLRGNTYSLELKRELPVTLLDGTEAALPEGTDLILTQSDGTKTYFKTQSGHEGSVTLEYRQNGMDSGWYINGVSENEYFVNLPYAG